MRLACLVALAAATSPSWGQQLTLYRLAPEEQPVTASVDVGSSAPGDALDTRMRVRNTGAAAVALTVLRISGTAFSLEGTPALGATSNLAPGVNADFRIRFRPPAPGGYSATLTVNSASYLVRGSSAAGLTLLRDGAPLPTDRTVEFAIVTVGQLAEMPLFVRNESTQDLPLKLTVTGAALTLAPLPLPAQIRAGEEFAFRMVFAPTRAGLVNGVLQLDTRSFNIAAPAREAEAPDAVIDLEPSAARSGRQSSLRIRLAAPAAQPATGLLRIELRPSLAAATRPDPAVQFLANSSSSIAVQVAAGESIATVSGSPDIRFQTGTTAGRLAFKLTLGSQERDVSIELPPEAPLIDTVDLRQSQGSVDVSITGFDNHRSSGNIVFTFTDKSGRDLPAISSEAGSAFAAFFRESELGGLFRLTARFPVSGGDASQLARVAVRLANAIGASGGRSEVQ